MVYARRFRSVKEQGIAIHSWYATLPRNHVSVLVALVLIPTWIPARRLLEDQGSGRHRRSLPELPMAVVSRIEAAGFSSR